MSQHTLPVPKRPATNILTAIYSKKKRACRRRVRTMYAGQLSYHSSNQLRIAGHIRSLALSTTTRAAKANALVAWVEGGLDLHRLDGVDAGHERFPANGDNHCRKWRARQWRRFESEIGLQEREWVSDDADVHILGGCALDRHAHRRDPVGACVVPALCTHMLLTDCTLPRRIAHMFSAHCTYVYGRSAHCTSNRAL